MRTYRHVKFTNFLSSFVPTAGPVGPAGSLATGVVSALTGYVTSAGVPNNYWTQVASSGDPGNDY